VANIWKGRKVAALVRKAGHQKMRDFSNKAARDENGLRAVESEIEELRSSGHYAPAGVSR